MEKDEGRGRRSNALLSAYYRNNEVGGVPGDPESPDFGGKGAAQKHAVELIQTLPLSRLLVCSTQLRKEAQDVESGLHAIVQESYTKFQTAAEVVGEVYVRSKDMENELVDVLSSVQKVAEGTEQVNARLAAGREKVEQLEGARRVLQLLRATRNLPKRMRELYASGNAQEAALRYSLILPSVSRLENIHSTFLEARKAIDATAKELREDISRTMNSSDNQIDPGEAVRLRIQLGESPEIMKDAFLESTAARVLASAAIPEPGFRAACDCLQGFSDGNSSILSKIVRNTTSFEKMFPDAPEVFSSWMIRVVDAAVKDPAVTCISKNTQRVEKSVVKELVARVRETREAATGALRGEHSPSLVATGIGEERSSLLVSLPGTVDQAMNSVLARAREEIFLNLGKTLRDIASEVLAQKRPMHILLVDYSNEIGLAVDCASILDKELRASEERLVRDDTADAANSVIEYLEKRLLRADDTSVEPRSVLIGAKICSLLDKEPRFRKANPMSLCPKLIREYVVRSSTRMAEPLRPSDTSPESKAPLSIREVENIFIDCLAEVNDVTEDSLRSTSASSISTPERRTPSRRNALVADDLGSLRVGLGTNMELSSLVIMREIMSSVLLSWTEFLRGTETTEEGVELVHSSCTSLKETVLESFPGSEEGLTEAIHEIMNTTRRRVRSPTAT
uniref:Vacuolar protein sorting-associated protein 51 homolog n=1 Tax=Rhodosorus marinus TaxID=101924 RepID=A0A7S3AAY0_9RHOD|mmetsp:Transcript_9765/g.41799  ORF Transcript_9765/g.41799 Transcript_9765/m.41799 type:complete len:681 (+) Transcript_9765:230-2272(+)|eukprot:CAMPEP_0113956646 /NCGR_PEP_ID=MMETSP0011_2-20120614/2197_1 /TAXON_ID=101924 /ORGANISM="Rhodosorus marinus" /LENGTH=680 /DNA_ID=CAMNT_0000966855 /DNA_START=178 /DNA_END=2220 /DNA_ORIENTATION=- /assembly_acc=CAM_ASM_000156